MTELLALPLPPLPPLGAKRKNILSPIDDGKMKKVGKAPKAITKKPAAKLVGPEEQAADAGPGCYVGVRGLSILEFRGGGDHLVVECCWPVIFFQVGYFS